MSSDISLTVAIPTYNRAEKVARLAHSILAQMHFSDELLVVDDGSPDQTAALLREIPGVRLHTHTPNQGMVKTWNACLTLAKHDWICIIHDDDLLCEGGLETIRLACAAAQEPALIIHTPIAQDEPGKFVYKRFPPGPSAVFCSATGTVPSGAVVHRKIVEALGGFDEALAYSADVEYFPRINTLYPLLVIESPPVVAYQLHEDNYQYRTWLKTDFYPQLSEIERRVVSYAGLKGSEATARFNERMLIYLTYINRRSTELKNKVLMRKYGLLLWQTQACRRRVRLGGLVTALKSWLPL